MGKKPEWNWCSWVISLTRDDGGLGGSDTTVGVSSSASAAASGDMAKCFPRFVSPIAAAKMDCTSSDSCDDGNRVESPVILVFRALECISSTANIAHGILLESSMI